MPSYPKFSKPKIIDYKEAPSGKIIITKYIEPFVPVAKGHGFIGVVAEDSKSGDLQCHVCGEFKSMLCPHYSQKHGMTGDEYRTKFGLLRTTALKNKRIRAEQSKLIAKMQKEGKMNLGNNKNINGKNYGFTKGNEYADNRKGKPKAIEHQNKFGVCDAQIKDAIMQVAKFLGKTPSLSELRDYYGGSFLSIMHQRYGSYIRYCRKTLKMEPNISTKNPLSKKARREKYIDIAIKKIKEGESISNLSKVCPELSGRMIKEVYGSGEGFRKAVNKKLKS